MNESGRHPVNVGQLVMGLALLGLVTVWALVVSEAVQGTELRWLMPMPWLVAGAVGLLASVVGGRRRAAQPFDQPVAARATPGPAATEAADTDHTEEIR